MNMQDEFYIPPPDPNAPKGPSELITQGLHPAVCCQIHNLGFQSFKGTVSMSPKCVIIWEVDQKMSIGTLAGKPMVIAKSYPMFMGNNGRGQPSILKAHLQGWRGRPFTEAELAAFTLKTFLSRPCVLNISHVPKLDNTMKAEITSILPATGPGWIPTYLETPKWVELEKAKQVYKNPQGPALNNSGYPVDW